MGKVWMIWRAKKLLKRQKSGWEVKCEQCGALLGSNVIQAENEPHQMEVGWLGDATI